MLSLQGKIAMVTGASAGIGEACARSFASLGANVILASRRIDRLKVLAAELKEQYNVDTLAMELDVRDYVFMETAFNELSDKWRSIDVLVNNAGLGRGLGKKVFEAKVSDWDTMVDTNIKGVQYLTRIVVPGMISRGYGHIVFLGSIAGLDTYPAGNVYCATKAAVRAFAKGTQMDLSGTGIRVTLVEPGITKTDFQLVRLSGDKDAADSFFKGVDALSGEDLADIISFCITRPKHVNIGEIVVTPTQQVSPFVITRRPE